MERKSVNEKIPFNKKPDDFSVYTDCIYRKISKKSPPAIYHFHEEIELLFCDEGELEVTLFSKSIILKPGDFLYLAPNTRHATTAHSDTNVHICIKFISAMIHVPSSRKIPSVDYYISLTPEYELFRGNSQSGKYIRDLFFSCIDNYSHDDYFKRLALRAS
ncbi:MAG: cupin domain-containing protein, partial [Clostridia bacterium]|nr:cupin domain-containing protein [Clostridia bacterium]